MMMINQCRNLRHADRHEQCFVSEGIPGLALFEAAEIQSLTCGIREIEPGNQPICRCKLSHGHSSI
jgi:hypothetical protein